MARCKINLETIVNSDLARVTILFGVDVIFGGKVESNNFDMAHKIGARKTRFVSCDRGKLDFEGASPRQTPIYVHHED